MRKKTSREQRESALASGWTVEGESAPAAEPVETPAAEPQASAIGAEDAPASANAVLAGEQLSDPASRDELDEDAGTRQQLSNGALVVLGVIGGLYLLYSWVWLSWAQYYSGVNEQVASASGSLGGVLQLAVFWAAPLAPALWFFSVLALNRGAKTLRIALWLLGGAVVLFPLPLLSGGAA